MGAFFLIASYGHFERAYEADTTRDKRTWRNSGLRYFGSGAPLLASGYLYWRKSWRELDEPSE